MSDRPFVDVKVVARCGKSTCVFLNSLWGITPGQFVDARITAVDDPAHTVISTKKVARDRKSSIVYLDKVWGFSPGDKVEIQITPRGSPDGS